MLQYLSISCTGTSHVPAPLMLLYLSCAGTTHAMVPLADGQKDNNASVVFSYNQGGGGGGGGVES